MVIVLPFSSIHYHAYNFGLLGDQFFRETKYQSENIAKNNRYCNNKFKIAKWCFLLNVHVMSTLALGFLDDSEWSLFILYRNIEVATVTLNYCETNFVTRRKARTNHNFATCWLRILVMPEGLASYPAFSSVPGYEAIWGSSYFCQHSKWEVA